MRTIERALDESPALAREIVRYVDVFYPAYRDKHLLVAGGIADQPARYLEIIGLVRAIDDRVQARALALKTDE